MGGDLHGGKPRQINLHQQHSALHQGRFHGNGHPQMDDLPGDPPGKAKEMSDPHAAGVVKEKQPIQCRRHAHDTHDDIA